jgi:BlaI family penicillinase repressor
MKRLPKISESEWLVMQVLWSRGPLTANEVVEELAGRTN